MRSPADRGLALVTIVLALGLFAALGLSLTLVSTTEMQVASNYAASRQVMYAADGAIEVAAQELLAFNDWNALLAGGQQSTFVDGPPNGQRRLSDGRTLSLTAATDAVNSEPRPWGPNNPRWALFAFGFIGPDSYVVAWVGDDPAENDGDPTRDGLDESNPGFGILALRAEAFGAGSARKVLEATVRRAVDTSGQPIVEMLSWHEIR